jgi:hypothetical protein
MGKRSIHVTSLPFNGKNNESCLRISVGYAEGGHNWYSGENNRKGFYAYVTPAEEIDQGTSHASIRSILGAGRKCLLEEATRFNAKKLETLAGLCMEHEAVKECIEVVSREYGRVK